MLPLNLKLLESIASLAIHLVVLIIARRLGLILASWELSDSTLNKTRRGSLHDWLINLVAEVLHHFLVAKAILLFPSKRSRLQKKEWSVWCWKQHSVLRKHWGVKLKFYPYCNVVGLPEKAYHCLIQIWGFKYRLKENLKESRKDYVTMFKNYSTNWRCQRRDL